MKFELKTENDNFLKSFSNVVKNVFSLAVIIMLCNISLKLVIISRQYQIDYNCKLLSIEKSASKFKKLSRLSKLKSKQKIWEFCKKVVY